MDLDSSINMTPSQTNFLINESISSQSSYTNQVSEDIRYIERNQPITLELANKLIQDPTNINTILHILQMTKNIKKLPDYYYTQIFKKLDKQDYHFFKTFTRNQIDKPLHQTQYEDLLNSFTTNYKNEHKTKFILREILFKIKCIINAILTVSYIQT